MEITRRAHVLYTPVNEISLHELRSIQKLRSSEAQNRRQ